MYCYPPPPGYPPSGFRTSPMAHAGYHGSARPSMPTTPLRDRGHQRRASHHESSAYFSAKRPPTYHAAYSYPSYEYVTPKKSSPEHVSFKHDNLRSSQVFPGDDKRFSAHFYSHGPQPRSSKKSHRVPPIYDVDSDEAFFEDERLPFDRSPPPPYNRSGDPHYSQRIFDADNSGYHQGPPPPDYRSPHHFSSSKHRSSGTRARATSYSTPSKPHKSTSTPAAAARREPPRVVTLDDLYKHEIPAGYEHKNWDPDEEPILLLGSVFDANSIGRWIYDWTVHRCGPSAPMADVAGDLWLLLIQLSGKMKRAEEGLRNIADPDEQELVEEFIDSGERLWVRFNSILKVCESYMWKYMKKEGTTPKKSSKSSPQAVSNSGCVFVDAIFGRDRQLENTEKLMTGMRLWSMRFDANCDDILRHPAP